MLSNWSEPGGSAEVTQAENAATSSGEANASQIGQCVIGQRFFFLVLYNTDAVVDRGICDKVQVRGEKILLLAYARSCQHMGESETAINAAPRCSF